MINVKVVDGKYNVTNFTLPNNIELTMITEYDVINKCFNKWIWQKGTKVARKVRGVSLGRSVSWVNEYETPQGLVKSNSLEVYTDDSVEWIESYFLEGKILHSIKGIASKIN